MNNKMKKIEASPNSVSIEVMGLEVTLSFAEREDCGVRECIIDILTGAYEKKRLTDTSEELLSKN